MLCAPLPDDKSISVSIRHYNWCECSMQQPALCHCSNCALHITSASSQPAVVWRHVLLTRCDTRCDTPHHVVTRGMSGVITVVTRVRILSRQSPTHPASACPHSQGVVPIKLCSGWTLLTQRPRIQLGPLRMALSFSSISEPRVHQF